MKLSKNNEISKKKIFVKICIRLCVCNLQKKHKEILRKFNKYSFYKNKTQNISIWVTL